MEKAEDRSPIAQGIGRSLDSRLAQAIRWLDKRVRPGATATAGLTIEASHSEGISATTLGVARWWLGIETQKSNRPNGSWIWERTNCET
jgi:hypothetical protein